MCPQLSQIFLLIFNKFHPMTFDNNNKSKNFLSKKSLPVHYDSHREGYTIFPVQVKSI